MSVVKKIAVVGTVALLAAGCAAYDFDPGVDTPIPTPPGEEGDGEGDGGPVTPIKRRPIVPGGKLKRPRVVDIVFTDNILYVGGTFASASVRNVATGDEIFAYPVADCDMVALPIDVTAEAYVLVLDGEDVEYIYLK